MLMIALIALLSMERNLQIASETVFEAIPEETGAYLEFPASISVDAQGCLYVLDTQARHVYVWDKHGKFISFFGQRGKGPGDLEFKEWNNL